MTRKAQAIKRFRVYTTEENMLCVRKAYTTLPRAMQAAARISLEATYAEVRDEGRRMSERLLAIFKNGNLLGQI